MRIGNLRHRVRFQQKSTTKDSTGQDVYTWVDFDTTLTRSASIKPFKGKELVEARGVYSEVQTSIMVRYDSETKLVDFDDRIVHTRSDGTQSIYAIYAVINHYERDRWIEFWCSEGLQDELPAATGDSYLLLENGSYFLLETGDKLILDGY